MYNGGNAKITPTSHILWLADGPDVPGNRIELLNNDASTERHAEPRISKQGEITTYFKAEHLFGEGPMGTDNECEECLLPVTLLVYTAFLHFTVTHYGLDLNRLIVANRMHCEF